MKQLPVSIIKAFIVFSNISLLWSKDISTSSDSRNNYRLLNEEKIILTRELEAKTNSNLNHDKVSTKNSAIKSGSVSCGARVITETKIIGGNQSVSGRWPWQAVVFTIAPSSGVLLPICGGSILGTKWILTAVHCINGNEASHLRIRLGAHNIQASESTAKDYSVSNVYAHSDYRMDENDISLIQLAGEIVYTDYIIPICLPSLNEDVEVGTQCWMTGWGVTKNIGEPQTILREAIVPVLDNTQCHDWYSLFSFNISDLQVCAGYENGRVGGCIGDGGGPLSCHDTSTNSFVLHGVNSLTIGCGLPNFPTVFTRVSKYVDWIEQTMTGNTGLDSFFLIQETACGSVISADQTIRLPLDQETQLYASNMNCMWTLRPPSDDRTGIVIEFINRFSIESLVDVCLDAVHVGTSPGTYVQTFCGFNIPGSYSTIVSPGSDLFLTFTSDGSNQFEGFTARVTFQNPSSIVPTTTTTTQTTTTLPSLANGECGVPIISKSSRIVGGTEAAAGNWPWQALFIIIGPNGAQSEACGGTLINNQWIVTAAHCTAGLNPTNIHIKLGAFDYDSDEVFAKEFPVSAIIDHPGYDFSSLVSDISLLKLGTSVIYTNHIIPACLPTHDNDVTVGLNCIISGWGNTEVGIDDTSILREATVPILTNEQCGTFYSGYNTIYDVHLCAGYEQGGIDTCQGDSGGPLVCQETSSDPFVLQGVTSFGIGCADPGFPGVYTRVSKYVNWVESEINANSGIDSFFSVPQTTCGSVISTNQTLRLPVNSETHLYAHNEDCLWRLQNNGETTTISFASRFTVELLRTTCWDKVTVSTFFNGFQSIMAELCGYDIPNDIVIPSGVHSEVWIRFTSDATVAYEGFVATVTFTSGDDSSSSPENAANRNFQPEYFSLLLICIVCYFSSLITNSATFI